MSNSETVLLIGQSNAGSPGKVVDMPSTFSVHRERTEIFSRHHPYWMNLRPGMNTQSLSSTGAHRKTFGLESGIADRLEVKRPHSNMRIIKIAYGGTTIQQWLGGLLAEAIKTVQASGETLDAVVWVQGEANTVNPVGYAEAETELVEALRAATSYAPFYSVLLNRSLPGADAVNDEKRMVNLPGHSIISTQWSGFQFQDGVHYDSETTAYIGRRIGNELHRGIA